METLPVELADIILNKFFCENPQDLYRLRLVSKAWKNIVDRCTARLLKMWCKKCSDEIPESLLDDFVQTRIPLSWQEYCSNKFAIPHIARDIYEFRNEYSNLVNNKVSLTEIYSSPPEMNYTCISTYAVNDKYLAISVVMAQGEETKDVLRIYSLNDLTHCIREYPIFCVKMYFYTTDNQVFIVLQKHVKSGGTLRFVTFLVDFLVNGNLIPVNLLPMDDYTSSTYVIVKNHCFTFDMYSNWLQHHRLTPSGFEPSTTVQLPFRDDSEFTSDIMNIQIFNSSLFVNVSCYNKKFKKTRIVVYKYQMTRQPNNKLFFSNPMIYIRKSAHEELRINFGADNISLQSYICDIYPRRFNKWIMNFFGGLSVYSVTIYAYHVLIACSDKFIVFRGNLRLLMDYATNNTNPGSRCTEIDNSEWLQLVYINLSDYVRVMHIESKPQFLVLTMNRAFMVNFNP